MVNDVIGGWGWSDPICLMQCTTPFVEPEHIIKCIEVFLDNRIYTFSANEEGEPTGACYVFSRRMARKPGLFDGVGLHILLKNALDIDDASDMARAETLL